MMGVGKTRDLFLWFMSIIYLFAFSSLYVQIPGLYGDNGLLPARLVLDKEADSWEEFFDGQPTLLKLTPKLGLDVQTGMDFLCLFGMLISFFCMVSTQARDVVSFSLLWMLYLSVYQVGQTFLWFQWDILLLEAGFLTILVAPLYIPFLTKRPAYHTHDSITMWLVRWLLFRLMFASGVVKLTSRCPTWWGLTALLHHFESQCVPTPLAWFWHHFPEWFLKLSCASTFVIEIAVPFLFFAPVRSLRVIAFYCQVILQVAIILTGNYNFFNLLTIALCIPLLDDEHFSKRKSNKNTSKRRLIDLVAFIVILGYLAYQTQKQFNLELNSDYTISSKIAFSEKDFNNWLEYILPITIWMAILSLGYEIFICVLRSFIGSNRSFLKKNLNAIQCLIFGIIAAGMFSISLVPHSVIETKLHRGIWPEIRKWHDKLEPYQITNSYGLFRMMTGVEGRPEVIVEGSHDQEKGWKEYEFLYKPGNPYNSPVIVAPHQPRLDWQMWFAALGNYQHNPWFLNFIYRLFNNQPEVLELMQHNPFPDKPPKYIRATLYTYHFSKPNKKPNGTSPTNWWTRTKKAEYLPLLTKDEPSFVQYLKHYKIVENRTKHVTVTSNLGQAVKWVRQKVGQPEGFSFVMSIFGSGVLANIINKLFIRV